MIKQILVNLISLAIGIFGTLYSINWQEEKLIVEFGEIAKFGEVTYQNIRIQNSGWNPATNIKVQIAKPALTSENITASPKFDIQGNENQIGGYERIRRNETITLSFAFKGDPITEQMLSVKSDRSIATFEHISQSAESAAKTDYAFVLFIMMVTLFALSIFFPAYQEYKRKVLEHKKQSAKFSIQEKLNNR